MGNCFSSTSSKTPKPALPIETKFEFPSPLPAWTTTDVGFAAGFIDLGGGLEVRQVSSFIKVWATHDGGPENLGATFFEPSPLLQGFSALGFYCHPNNKPFIGWVLVVKDNNPSGDVAGAALQKPLDYTLVWSSSGGGSDGDKGYIWLPTAPDGYKAVGHVVTTSPEKPSVDKIRCVRSDLTDQSERDTWIWGPAKSRDDNGFNVYSFRPINRGITATGVSVGSFVALPSTVADANSPFPLFCLKNSNSLSAAMPNNTQISSLFEAYSPIIYFHPKEKFLPSSVNWFFSNGALLYEKTDESNPVPINQDSSNLPQGGVNDGLFWLNLPADDITKERLKHGDLQNSQVYLHIKPMLGGTFTDVVIWLFFPFNGPATAKAGIIDIPFRKIGEHIGDWEHLTLRISNFNGELWRVYFAQHSKGTWVDAAELEFGNGNKVVAYSSLNGHAAYPMAGLVMQGSSEIGIKNETAKSELVLDAGAKYSVVAAEYLESAIIEPPWVNYSRDWGPRIEYPIAEEIEKVEDLLPGKLKEGFRSFVKRLPDEFLGEEGPTGPKFKNSWNGDEP